MNGLGETLLVGESPARELRALAGWPLPYRGGVLNVSFLAASLGGIPVDTRVGLYDVAGRLVRRIAGGRLAAGMHLVTWDGDDERGESVAPGMYFLRVASGGFESTLKVTVAR